MVTSFSEIDKNEYLDPRTAQVATVDHVKQVSSVVSITINSMKFLDDYFVLTNVNMLI